MRRDDLDDLVLVDRRAEVGRRREVPRLALVLRHRVVRDLLHEVLEEPVLAAVRQQRVDRDREHLLADERAEQRGDLGLRESGDRAQPLERERAAEDGPVLQEPALRRLQAVQPRGDQRLEGLGHLERLDRPLQPERAVLADQDPAVDQHPDGLHRIERDALGALEDALPDVVGEPRDRIAEQGAHLVAVERLQEDRREVAGAGAPARPALRELRPRERQHEDRPVARPLHQILDEIEQRAVGPVDVLEHHDRRSLIGDPLEEDPAGREQVLLVADATLLEPEQVTEARPDEPALVRVGDVPLDRLRELGRCGRRLLVLEDPGPSADHLGERPERNALAVREAPSLVPPDVGDQPVDVFLQLPDQPGLPDPGDPLHGDQVDLPVLGGVVEQILDQAELAIAAGEGWLDRGHPAEPPEADDPVGPPELDRGLLALQLERAGRFVGDHRVGGAHRRLPDEDRAGRRDRLDPRGGVHEIARHHALVLGRRA